MTNLVLMPGMDGTGEFCQPFIAALPEDYYASSVSYPRDAVLPSKEFLNFIRICSGIHRSYILVAESFSTPYAIELAATNPENLKALVLCAGFASNPATGWQGFVLKYALPFLFRFPISDFALQRWLVGTDASPELLQAIRKAISSVRPDVMKDRLRIILSSNQRTNLSKIKIPILYLEAKQDRLIPNSCFKEIKCIQPNTILAHLDGPHLILQREPQKASAIIQDFISTLML